jgi:hypothetical protein
VGDNTSDVPNNSVCRASTNRHRTAFAARRRSLLTAALLSLMLAPTATAHAQGWPTLEVRVGGLVADLTSQVQVNGSLGNINSDIDLEDDLGFDTQANTYFLDGVWRISKRNQIQVGFINIDRDISNVRPARDITFRDQTFTINSEVDAFLDSWYLTADYGFAFIANPSIEFGVIIGVTLMKFETGIELTATAGGGQPVSRELADRAEFTAPIPLPGLFLNLRPHPRVELNGSMRFIKATIDKLDGSSWEGQFGGDFKVWSTLGVGAAYYLNNSNLDRDGVLWDGGFEYNFSGPQLYVTFGF